MDKIYVCSPLHGDIEENIEKAKQYAEYVFKCGAVPIVPHFYAYVLDDNIPEQREKGRKAGMEMLWCCDELWVFTDTVSEGMKNEIRFCEALNIPIKYINREDLEKEIKTYEETKY